MGEAEAVRIKAFATLAVIASMAGTPPAAAGQAVDTLALERHTRFLADDLLEGRGQDYARTSRGTRRLENAAGVSIRMLVERSNLGGGEVEIGEITFPPGTGANARPHTHGRLEVLYVLSGRLEHVVNGEAHVVEPGMAAIVRPGDGVVHRVLGDAPVRALVIWAPGGELERIAPFFEERPVGSGAPGAAAGRDAPAG